ncbi:MAG: DNA-binding Lrp family transcriptional regulator [Ilumatobacter sp.]|jgi:DNA-binding Lrp family transcriptional regulator
MSHVRELDEIDRQILELLREDARLSARELGRRLGVAAGTIGSRVRRLEETGVIRGYRAEVEPGAMGRSLGFVVGLEIAQGAALDTTLDELLAAPEIDEVLVVTGRWDLLVIGRVADPSDLNRLLTLGLWQSPSFRHSETMVVTDGRRAVGY